jgi:flagellum-specific ATP synthase
VESDGPEVSLGEVCEIVSTRKDMSATAEVVGFRDNRVLLMPLGDIHEIHPGCQVVASTREAAIPVGDGLVGRVIDGWPPHRRQGPPARGARLGQPEPRRAQPHVPPARITEGFSTACAVSTASPPWAPASASEIFAGPASVSPPCWA